MKINDIKNLATTLQKNSKGESVDELISSIPADIIADIVTRKKWGAREPKSKEELKTPVKVLVLKYGTKTPPCYSKEECIKAVQEIQRRHMDELGMPDIGYNFLVGSDGNVYEGRGWKAKSEPYLEKDKRYKNLHSKSIDVVFIGEWIDNPPQADMMSAVADLCKNGYEKGYLIEDWDVFEPSRLKKPIIKHGEGFKVATRKDTSIKERFDRSMSYY